MKKRGFTLIELLAVIVILAIIALIATPIVMKVIDNASKAAAERSTENFLSAAEQAMARGELNGNSIVDGTYTYDGTKLVNGTKEFQIDIKGTKPENGSKVIVSGSKITGVSDFKVKQNGTIFNISIDATTKKATATKVVAAVYTEGQTVYFNPVAGTKCTSGSTNCNEWKVININDDNTLDLFRESPLMVTLIEACVDTESSLIFPNDYSDCSTYAESGANATLVTDQLVPYNIDLWNNYTMYGDESDNWSNNILSSYTLNNIYSGDSANPMGTTTISSKYRNLTVYEYLKYTNYPDYESEIHNSCFWAGCQGSDEGYAFNDPLRNGTYTLFIPNSDFSIFNQSSEQINYYGVKLEDDLSGTTFYVGSDGNLFDGLIWSNTFYSIFPVIRINKSLLN